MDSAEYQKSLTMEQMWQEVVARFEKRTKMTLDIRPARTLDDCIADIERRQLPMKESEAASTKEKAKEYGINILRCLKLLGGVAAQGADMVFAPSSLCFNALSLLLDVPEKLQGFHAAVDGLFETLGPSLSVFKIYGKIEQFDKVEPELKQAIQQLMVSFIDICALSIELRNSGKWRKFKVAAKLTLLDDDSGVKGEISHFKILTEAHTSVQATQTLKAVLENHGSLEAILAKASETGQRIDEISVNVANIRDAEDKRKAEDTKKKHIAGIQDKLGVQDKALKASKETYDTLRNDCMPGTCSWFKDAGKHSSFQAWAERSNIEASPVLLLRGEPNTGKSVLMSCIMHHLRSMYEAPSRQSPRSLIAYYFFPSSTGKSDEDKQPVETALKCIAMQFAEQDAACAKKMSQKLDIDTEKDFRNATCEKIWDLIIECLPRGKSTSHFVLLDGLGSLPSKCEDALRGLFAILENMDPARSPIRAILSVRPDTIRVGNVLASSWPKLDMQQHNAGDIRKYIDHVLKAKDIFQDSDEHSTRILAKIQDRLTNKVGGSYYKVATALENIEAVILADGEEPDIDRVLDESSRDEKAISQSLIEGLEETLQAKEITELNELLVWVIFGHVTFHVKQLELVLSLRSKTHSLLKLEKKLKGKYGKIFNVLSGGYVEVADDIEALLREERTQSRIVDETPKFSATITITKADLTSVQSFLWSFMQKASQDHFGFQQLVDQNSVKGRIGVNEIDAHLIMIRQTFAILADPPDEKTQGIACYLLDYLPQHLEVLEQATGVDALTPSEKSMIGEGLFSLFVSGDVIQNHWDSCGTLIWYRDDDEVEIFRRWLKDPSVARHLGSLDREWLKEVEDDPNPNRALLYKVMKMVAWHWLQDSEWDTRTTFTWVQGILSLTGSHQSGEDDEENTEQPPEMTVEMVADRCRDALGVSSPDALWYERLGETCTKIETPSQAVDYFHSALDLGNPTSKSYMGLAEALAMMDNHTDACLAMDKALDILEKEEPLDKPTVIDIYTNLSSWYVTLGKNDEAVLYMKKALVLSPDDYLVHYTLFKLYLRINDTASAVALLEELAKVAGAEDESSALAIFIENMINDTKEPVILKCFAAISGVRDLFQHLLEALDQNIGRTARDDRPDDMVTFLLYKGIAIYHFGQDWEATPIKSALACWDRCFEVDIPWAQQSNTSMVSRLLSAHHFDHAATSTEIASQQRHIERLEELINAESPYSMSAAKAYLASYYTRKGDPARAKTVLHGCIDSAFDLLTDESDENDSDGYYLLASILLYCGDDANALSAYSTLIPPPDKGNVLTWLLDFDQDAERCISLDLINAMEENHGLYDLGDQATFVLDLVQKRLDEDAVDDVSINAYKNIQSRLQQVPMSKVGFHFLFTCDGLCNKRWDFETPMYACKYCYDRGFCGSCLEDLKQGKLKPPTLDRLACSKNHEWLRLPQWDKQSYLDSLRGNVKTSSGVESAATFLETMKEKLGFRGGEREE